MLSIEFHGDGRDGSATADFRLSTSAHIVDTLSMTAAQWLELKGLFEAAASAWGVDIDIRGRGNGSPAT